jgi:hypothetical protein
VLLHRPEGAPLLLTGSAVAYLPLKGFLLVASAAGADLDQLPQLALLVLVE